jgi:uncharacterized OsmC-like protein
VAGRHNIKIEGTKAEILKVMGDNPRRVIEVHIDMYFPKNNFSDSEKELLERTALNCPVAKSLHPDIKQKTRFHY